MIKNILKGFIKIIQKILISVALFVIYYFGLGITFIFSFVFNREVLSGRKKDKDTFWIRAEGYQNSIEESRRQS